MNKEHAWNNLNNDDRGFLFLTKRSQEEHSCSTQRLRSLSQEQKDKSECSSYFMHVPKSPFLHPSFRPSSVDLQSQNPQRSTLRLRFCSIRSTESRRLSENRSLLRKSGFWPIIPIKFVKYSKYSPHLIKKMDSKPLSLTTTSIIGQPPSLNLGAKMITYSFPNPKYNVPD